MIDPLSSSRVAAPAAAAGQDGLAKVARQFEAVFLRQMIRSVRQAGLADGLFGSSAEDQFRDMADARLADDMAGQKSGGGFGIAELLTRQLGASAAPDGPKP